MSQAGESNLSETRHEASDRLHPSSLLLMILIPLLVLFASLFVGRYPISPVQTVQALLSAATGAEYPNLNPQIATLVVNVRLPRAIAGAFVGFSLALSGAAFQSVFRNPLTDAGLLGVSNGAGFGAAFAIVFLGGGIAIYFSSFLFGIIAVIATYNIARVYRSTPTTMLILGGVVVSSIFSALLSIMKYVADPTSQLPSIVYWLMGSLADVGFQEFWALVPMVVGAVVLLIMSWRIDALAMGDKEARTLGINVKREKGLIISAATLATAGAVCLSGVIGWVGLVIPHIARMMVGNAGARLMPTSLSLGATFMMVVDLCARTLWPAEVPLGILTALIGAPFFIYLLKKTKGGGW